MEEKQETKKTFVQRFLTLFPLLSLIGLVVGALGGYLYYVTIGCSSGTCSITSNPWMSTLWGAIMGYLLFDLFNRNQKPAEKS